MSLRARFALALGVLAAIAVVVVSTTSYVVTRNSTRTETDRSLRDYAVQLSNPDGRTAARLCNTFGNLHRPPGGFERPDDEPQNLPGAQVQCLARDGTILQTSDADLPVTDADKAVAAHTKPGHIGEVTASDGGSYRVYTVAVSPSGAVQIAQSTATSERALDTVRNRALVVGGLVILLAAAAGWFIARRTAKPLQDLTDTAERVAETGRPEPVGASYAGRDEVSRLGRSFTTMLAALTRARDEQQRLAQDAGHELRTPLTSLRTNIETLRRYPNLSDEMRQKIVDDLAREEGELQALVEELVALVSDEEIDEEPTAIELGPLVSHQADRVRARSGRPIDVAVDGTRVVGQRRRIERVVANLLDNAVKFSTNGDPVEVGVHDGVLVVRDHGPGFQTSDLPHVFERFYRADLARSRPGSGLGLSIVHDVVAAHGGTVTAANADGGGAVLTVTLPNVGDHGRLSDAPE